MKKAAIVLSEVSKSGVDYWQGKTVSGLMEWLELYKEHLQSKRR